MIFVTARALRNIMNPIPARAMKNSGEPSPAPSPTATCDCELWDGGADEGYTDNVEDPGLNEDTKESSLLDEDAYNTYSEETSGRHLQQVSFVTLFG